MSVPFKICAPTTMARRALVSGGLTALPGLVDDPDHQCGDQGYEQHPEQQREQHAEQTTAHHGAAHHLSHGAHHCASTEDRDEQQDYNRPDQGSQENLQAVAHGLLTPPLSLSDLSIPS